MVQAQEDGRAGGKAVGKHEEEEGLFLVEEVGLAAQNSAPRMAALFE